MRKRVRLKQLTLGVAAALLAGSWQVPAWAAEAGPIRDADKKLTENTTIKADGNNGSAIVMGKKKKVDLAGHDLDLQVEGLSDAGIKASGIYLGKKGGLTLFGNENAPDSRGVLNISVVGSIDEPGKSGAEVSGIHINSEGYGAKADIRTDVTIKKLHGGKAPVRGIWASSSAKLDIGGTFKIEPGAISHYGLENGWVDKKKVHTFGIHLDNSKNKVNIETVDIDDPKLQRGIQIGTEGREWQEPNGNVLRIGGGKLKIKENEEYGHWLMHLIGESKVYINAGGDETDPDALVIPRDKATELEGAVHIEEKGTLYLGLNGAASSWKGGTEGNAKGKVNLFLLNGATWDTSNGGRGSKITNLSSHTGTEGHIRQNDAGKLHIENYAGRQKLFYTHTGDGTLSGDYAAGDTYIKRAAAGSKIMMVTENTGNIDTQNEEQVQKALNALAGKLYYEEAADGIKNLKGEAMIAEGLTGSSAAMGEIVFNPADRGQGNIKSRGPLIFNRQIADNDWQTGDLVEEDWGKTEYSDGKSHYTFRQDVALQTEAATGNAFEYIVGGVMAGSEGLHKDGWIDMKGHRLSLHAKANSSSNKAAGISIVGNSMEIKNAGGVDIEIEGDKRSQSGIYLFSTSAGAKLAIDNDNKPSHAVKIRNTATGEKEAAILVDGAHEKAQLRIKGLVDIAQQGDVLQVKNHGSEVFIGGGSLVATGSGNAVRMTGETKVYINAEAKGDTLQAASDATDPRDVQMKGNVLLGGGKGDFGMALNTKSSWLAGLVGMEDAKGGKTRMILSDGARWSNKSYGQIADGFAGSHLTRLQADGGAIFQKDARPIAIDSYKGNMTVFYDHTEDGTKPEHYEGGDLRIYKADADSSITMVTHRDHVDTGSALQTRKTLKALAGKLYYEGAKRGETNLRGKAMLAESLTMSSESLKIEDLLFDKTTGQGGIKNYRGRQIVEGSWDGADDEKDHWGEKGIRSGSTYTLNENVTLAVERTDDPVKVLNDEDRYDFGGILWGKGQRGSIEMNGHELNINVGEGNLHTQAGKLRGDESTGILVSGGTLELKSLGKTSIKAQNNGIHLLGDAEKGNAELFIHNGAAEDPAVAIRSSGKGIYLESTVGAANLDVKGKVDIEAPQGIVVDRGKLTIGGGKIVSKGDAALYVNSISTAKINADAGSEGNIVPIHENRDVQIEGDIRVKDSSAAAYVGLTTKNSFLKGLFTTDMHTWPLHQWEWASGKGYLVLKNGAAWEHVKVGTGMDKNGELELGDSRVDRLNADGGIIRQKDKRSILIDDFRGNMKVIYEHENDGSKATDYAAGDVKITAAQQGSDVTMMTDSKNITLSDDAQVRSVLDALAGKLYYDDARSGRTNLKGTAMIAEGLTASSVSKKTVDIFFRSSDGKGYTRDTVENGIYKNFHGLDTGIDRSNKESLTFDNFSGSARFFYKHVNDGTQTEDYGSDPDHKDSGKFYGDTHIRHAAANSSVMMITDRQGVDTSDETAVRKTLSALAGKLYYDGYVQGERNLAGKAMIAEGLTGSAISQELDLDYWLSDGRAYVKSKDTAPLTVETIEKQIAEGNFDTNDTKAYWKGKDIYDGKGNYTFHRDIKLVTKAADNPVISAKDNKFGTIYWNGDVQGSIDMTGHRLDVKAGPGGHGLLPGQGPNAGWERTPNAITVYSGTLAIKNVKGMDIESDPKGSLYGRGIFVMGYPGGAGHMSGHGKAKLVIENDDNPAHAIKIRVKDTGEDFGAIEARKNMGSAEVDIKGLVDIDSKMWRAVESHGARVSIGGGIIKGSDVASIAAYEHGTVFVNAKLDDGRVVATSATRPVQITGDISSEGGGHIVLGLNNKDSFFKGLASTDINGIDKQTQKWIYNPGDVSLLLANGATWEHKQVGTGYHHKKETGSHGKGIAMDSHVTRLQADKGVLRQGDPHNLTIDNYAGDMRLVYQHEGDGTKAEHYKAGDVHIKKAQENSSVTMVTDSSGLSLTDETQVYKTLNALAGKLYYDGYKNGERNLKGTATIAEGLVETSKTLKLADMEWSESSGQGTVKGAGTQPGTQSGTQSGTQPGTQSGTQSGTQPKFASKIEYGDYETKLMSGVKSAMTASTMVWRAESNDLMKRMGDLRLSPEDEGIWAHVYHGKSSSDKDKANFHMNYTTLQVGYDKTVSKDWRVGVAGSYMKGSSSYANGSGKNKEGNLGVYGTWTGKNGEYVDLIAKVGRLTNEFTVYNDFGHYVKGDFQPWGVSLSAEYGRRINMKGGSFIEPQVEMIYTHLNGVDYAGETDYVGQRMYVRQNAMNSFIGRLGVGIGQETERSTWFLKASLYHEFGGALSTDYSDGTSPWKTTHQSGKDTWVGLQLGGTTKLNDRTSLYGTFEKTFGGDVKTDWRVDAGIRWSF